MKFFSNPMFCSKQLSKGNRLLRQLLIILAISLFMFGLAIQEARAEEPYRFDRVWPKLEQPWYFYNPSDVAIGPDGFVYVADTDNYRIAVFDAKGVFIRDFTTLGVGNGSSTNPHGIDIGQNGLVFVNSAHQVNLFNSIGKHIFSFGLEYYGTVPGIGSSSNGYGIAANSNNIIYVARKFNSKIDVYDINGKLIRSWGNEGSGPGQFKMPTGIAINKNNFVFVTDSDNHRIQVFNSTGQFIRSWGNKGTEEGEFDEPKGIAVNEAGLVYVVDSKNERIQVFNSEGGFIRSWSGQFSGSTGITINSDGFIYVSDAANSRIQVFNEVGLHVKHWGSQTDNLQLISPKYIATDSDGLLYVNDENRVHIFDQYGVFIRGWDAFSSGGMAVNSKGVVYLSDTFSNVVKIYNADGELINTWSGSDAEDGQFYLPKGIAVSNQNLVYIIDGGKGPQRIQVFKEDGTFVHDFEIHSFVPRGIAVSNSGLVYVTTSFALSNEIEVYDSQGNFIDGWVSYNAISDSEKPGQFILAPYGVNISSNGLVYVTDLFNDQVLVFDAQGKVVEKISSHGTDYGQLNNPHDLVINSDGDMFVADTGNNRIQKFVRGKAIATKHPHKAIILAGGGPPSSIYNNLIWNETQQLTNKARRALNVQGYQKDEIKYLTAGNTLSDLDGNGKFDDLEQATLASLQQAITDWASDASDVIIYLMDHGGPGRFQINSTEILHTNQLQQWVDTLDAKIPGRVTVIIESCKSGSFLGPLAAQQRYLISSSDAKQPAVISNQGLNAFSYYFWSEIDNGADLKTAFSTGRQGMSSHFFKGRHQNAQLDSNGDQQFNSDDLTCRHLEWASCVGRGWR